MKAMIIVLSGPFMLMFVMAAAQTIEYHWENGLTIPWQAYGLLVLAGIWIILASRVKKKDWKSFKM